MTPEEIELLALRLEHFRAQAVLHRYSEEGAPDQRSIDAACEWVQKIRNQIDRHVKTKSRLASAAERVQAAINIAIRYGGIDGSHHKMWVIDQMLRILSGSEYDNLIRDANHGEDGPNTYEWDIGIAP
jgi:hypothetical protein